MALDDTGVGSGTLRSRSFSQEKQDEKKVFETETTKKCVVRVSRHDENQVEVKVRLSGNACFESKAKVTIASFGI